MKNPTFEISRNGSIIETVGLNADHGVLTSIFTWVKNESLERLSFSSRGIDSDVQKSFKWETHNLSIGDVIEIKITSNPNLTEAETELLGSGNYGIKAKLEQFRALKEELKDFI